MKMKNEIPYRNRSPDGWWIAVLIRTFVYEDESRVYSDTELVNQSEEKFYIIRAVDREELYSKALKIGDSLNCVIDIHPLNKRRRHWSFSGISYLSPIHEDDYGDGSELFCGELKSNPVTSLNMIVCSKDELDIFDDSDPVDENGIPYIMGDSNRT